MVAKNEQEELMVRYLLGQATEEDRTHVEKRFLSDHDYFERLLALEEVLVDQYATGNLPVQQRESFEKHSGSQRRENIEFTRELIEDIRQKKLASKRPVRLGASTVIFSRPYLVRNTLALAILLLLVAAPWIVALSLRQRLTEAQVDLAGKQRNVEETMEAERRARFETQQQLNDVQQSGVVNESYRLLYARLEPYRSQRNGGGQVQVIEITARLQIVVLDISLEKPTSYKSYQVRIISSDDPSPITISGLTLEKERSTLKVPISASTLQRGDYSLTVFGEADNKGPVTIDNYSFRVKLSN